MQEQAIKNNDDTDGQSMRILFLSTGPENLFCGGFFIELVPSKARRSPHNKITVIHFFFPGVILMQSFNFFGRKRETENIGKSLEVVRVCGIKFHNNLLDF